MRIYLDQNIMGYLYNGSAVINTKENIDWVYSNEHFVEISRGNNIELLEVLKELKAKEIKLELDNNFRMTGKAFFEDYSSPIQKYNDYLETINEVNVDDSIFTDLLVRLAGGSSYEEVKKLPDRIEHAISDLLEDAGIFSSNIKESMLSFKPELQNSIDTHLVDIPNIESMRENFGTKYASNKDTYENPIIELWEIISKYYNDVTIDQFFGFNPIDKMGYDEWPLYLGIIACHTALNFIGYHPDKGMNKEDKIKSILSDGNHIGHAIYCEMLISADSKLCAKATAIYKYSGVQTFVNQFRFKNG